MKDFKIFLEKALKDKNILREIFADSEKEASETDCLSDEIMADMIDNILPPEEKELAFAHIAWCDECLKQFLFAADFLESEEASVKKEMKSDIESCQDKIRRFVLVVKSFPDRIVTLFQDGGFIPVAIPVPAMARGTCTSEKSKIIALYREVPPFNFQMEIEKGEEELYYLRILIREPSKQPVNNIRASLFKDGEEHDSYITKVGRVSFEGLKVGKYIIKILDKGNQVCEFDISLK